MYASPPRRAERFLWRSQCEVYVSGRRQVGVIINISKTGLFVQTATTAAHRGAVVLLNIPASENRSAFLLETLVARRQFGRAGLGGGWTSGIGLQLVTSSPQFEAILQNHAALHQVDSEKCSDPIVQDSDKAQARNVVMVAEPTVPTDFLKSNAVAMPTASQAASLFRVRVMLQGTTRSRMLTVSGTSADEARAKALAQIHQDWRVVEVAPRCS